MLLQVFIAAAAALGPAPVAGQAPSPPAPVAARTISIEATGKARDPAGGRDELAPRPRGPGLVCGPVPDGLRDIGWQHGRCRDATDAAALALLAPYTALSTGGIFL